MPAVRYHAVLICPQEPEGVIASDSVEDVVLEDCHARAITFNCPNMRQLSLKLSNIVSFTLLDCSSLRSLDLQCESTSTMPVRCRLLLECSHRTATLQWNAGACSAIVSLWLATCILPTWRQTTMHNQSIVLSKHGHAPSSTKYLAVMSLLLRHA